MNPGALWVSLFCSLFLIKPQPSSASLFFLSFCALWIASGQWGGLVKCPVPSVTSSAVVRCHSSWGLPLKPKAAREDTSDGFCPLFHSLAFIPLCSNRHQGRFLTSMLFRQWCQGHWDVVLCLRPSSTGREKTQDSDAVKSGFQNIMTDGYIIDCSAQRFSPHLFPWVCWRKPAMTLFG